MGTAFKRWDGCVLADEELTGEAESRYLYECEQKNADILRYANMVADIKGGMYWTDADEAILQCAQEAAARKARIVDALFSQTGELCSAVTMPMLLTDELVKERRAVMLEACRIYREAAPKFSGGGLSDELLRRVDEFERKAEALERYEGGFDAARYYA